MFPVCDTARQVYKESRVIETPAAVTPPRKAEETFTRVPWHPCWATSRPQWPVWTLRDLTWPQNTARGQMVLTRLITAAWISHHSCGDWIPITMFFWHYLHTPAIKTGPFTRKLPSEVLDFGQIWGNRCWSTSQCKQIICQQTWQIKLHSKMQVIYSTCLLVITVFVFVFIFCA